MSKPDLRNNQDHLLTAVRYDRRDRCPYSKGHRNTNIASQTSWLNPFVLAGWPLGSASTILCNPSCLRVNDSMVDGFVPPLVRLWNATCSTVSFVFKRPQHPCSRTWPESRARWASLFGLAALLCPRNCCH